jgi:outer membrane protein assembly complex protein YaeT
VLAAWAAAPGGADAPDAGAAGAGAQDAGPSPAEPPARRDLPQAGEAFNGSSAPKPASETSSDTSPAQRERSAPKAPGAGPERAQPTDDARAAPRAPAIDGYDLDGTLIDKAEDLQALLRSIAPEGSPFVASGPADRIGIPIGTVPRLARALAEVGYGATFLVRPVAVTGAVTGAAPAARVRVQARLLPYDRIRYIFVSGNGRIRQDEIQRRITIRPGSPLPLPGPDRDVAIERERQRVIDFLRGEGYFESNVRIDLQSRGAPPAPTDMYITVRRGPAYPLGPITVTGNSAISTSEITELFRHTDWLKLWTAPVPFTAKQLREDLDVLTKRYRALGYVGARVTSDFSPQKSVDRDAKQVRLGIVVNERKRITVAFEGNEQKSSSTLRDELTLFDRGAYDDYEVSSSADALEHYYQQRGFFFARVAWRRERLSETEERIVFVIDEGPELKVRGVDFTGNRSIGAAELREVVSVRPYPFLGFAGLGKGGYVTGRQMRQDAERLVEHYRARGFPDARATAQASTNRAAMGMIGAIAAGAETASRDAHDIYVRFVIEEGPRVFMASVDFKTADGGPLPYRRGFLMDSLALRAGDPFSAAAVREDGRRLERLLGDAGYPAASVEPNLVRDGDRQALTWVMKTGPATRVGPVFVRGNFVTKPRTILEQIPLEPGQLLTTTGTERGQRNLGFLQLFNNAAPISFPGKDEKRSQVPMLVQVEERYEQYSVIHFGVGASTEQKPPDSSIPIGFFARAGYENRDLFGHGWNFAGQAAYGTSLLRANLTFLDRRFFGTLFRFDASLNYLQQATARLGDIRSGGGSIGFSREMAPGVDAGIHYNLRNTTHTESLLRPAGPDEQQGTIQLGTTVGSLSFNVEWLRLDNRLVPTRGFKLDAVAEVALPELSTPLRPLPFPLGDDTFVKVGIHSLSVIPLTRWLSVRHGLRFDQGIPLGGASLLPKVERYFAGGDTTLRGYQLDRARIEEVRYPILPGLDGVEYRPLGGNLRILQNIDLQFPISPPFYGAVFMDNGVVADSLDGLSASKFRHGAGITPLLLKLPVGDLSVAWAWPLDPGPGDTRIGVLHVNIGLLF